MAGLLDEYPMPVSGTDPQELERLKYLTLMRMGLGVAGREPLGSAMQGGINTYVAGEESARRNADQRMQDLQARMKYAMQMKAAEQEKALQGQVEQVFTKFQEPVQQYLGLSETMARAGKDEAAKRYADIANQLRTKYNTTPQVMKDRDGKLVSVLIGERGETMVVPYQPAEKLHFANTQDKAGVGLNAYTGVVESQGLPQGISQADAARLAIERQRLAKEGAGQLVETPDGYVRVTPDNKVTPVMAGSGQQLQAKPAAAVVQQIAQNNVSMANIDAAIAETRKNPKAFGLQNYLGDPIQQRRDPKGVAARAMVANIGSLKIHDRTGAAMSAMESMRLKPFVPNMEDKTPVVIRKLELMQEEYKRMQAELAGGRSLAEVANTPSTVASPMPEQKTMSKISGSTKVSADQIRAQMQAIQEALDRDKLGR